MIVILGSSNRVTGWFAFILYTSRMEVMFMDKKSFDFKDILAFATFILSLLTFIFSFCR